LGRLVLDKLTRFFLSSTSTGRDSSTSDERPLRDEWSIGIYVGGSPFHFASPAGLCNPVLTREHVTDVKAAYVADPFMLRIDGLWYLFFEVMNQSAGKGEIGLAVSENGVEWAYRQIVLSEPFHLSYPYVFQHGGDVYMIPETHQASAVRLYRAVDFPNRWSFVATLLGGLEYVDPSLCHFGDTWWLFVGLGSPPFRSESLRLYYAKHLKGPWIEHPKSPVVDGNAHIARPAGRLLATERGLVRYTQDCDPVYGQQVRAFEITALDETDYQERLASPAPVLEPAGQGWNEVGMHHIDPHRLEDGSWLACVDGWRWVPGS